MRKQVIAAAVIAACVATGGTAVAHDGEDHEAQGPSASKINPSPPKEVQPLPEGSAPKRGQAPPVGRVAPDYAEYEFEGGLIPRDEAARRGLGCFMPAEGRTRCYRSKRAMADAEKIATPGEVLAESRVRALRAKGKRAKSSNHYGSSAYPLYLFQHTVYNGWYVAANSYCQWFNMSGFYNDSASRLQAGQHSGYTSSDANGGGAQGGWAAWGYYPNMHDYGWGDITSARARACI